MRRRGKGLFGQIFSFIGFLIFIGVMIAVLKEFHWDIFSALNWFWDKCVDFVNGIANSLSKSALFNNLFSSKK